MNKIINLILVSLNIFVKIDFIKINKYVVVFNWEKKLSEKWLVEIGVRVE